MNWLGERPRSIVEAWNILCEALNERMEYFGYSGGSFRYYPIPPLPCLRGGYKIREMIGPIRAMICRMVGLSWDWGQSGSWSSEPAGFGNPEKADDPLFVRCGIDGKAFFCSADTFPTYRHSSSDFIKAAAAVLNFAVRHPAPVLCRSAPVTGFGISALLEAQSFEKDLCFSGSSQSDGVLQLPDNMSAMRSPAWDVLAQQVKNVGRSRAYDHRCIYSGAGKESGSRIMPYLSGSCGIRLVMHAGYLSGISGEVRQTVELGEQEFVIDLETGIADRELDFSRIKEEISTVWNRSDENPAVTRNVILEIDSMEVQLAKENFQPLTYKYME